MSPLDPGVAGVAGWLIEALIGATLLMAAVLLLRRPVRRAFGPEVAYWLWALPLLRLLLPPLPAEWGRAAALPVARAGEAVAVLVVDAAPTAAATVQAPSLAPLVAEALAIVWAAGAVLFLLRHLFAHRAFCRRIEAGAVEEDVVEGIRLVTSAAAHGPLAFGLFRRTVAFPVDIAERYDAEERALALAHEIGHHRRGDLFANWAALGVLALHWFNPLAWAAFRAFRTDQELANNARVLAGRSPVQRHIYACAIVKAAHGHHFSAACHLHTVADLKGRLKMLATSPRSRRRLASGAAAVAALAVAGLGLTASASGAAAIAQHVEQVVAAPPAPPAPPAVAEAAEAPATPAAPDHRISRVIVTHKGKTTVHDDFTTADIDAAVAAGDRVSVAPAKPGMHRMIVKMDGDPGSLVEVQDIPAISSARCGIGSGTPASMVIESGKGPKRKIVICTDRIQMVTADAMAKAGSAHDMEHNAYEQALTGLLDARTKMTADVGMSDADRSRALAAIDTSIAEMKSQLARGR